MPTPPREPVVVLLHGLARDAYSLVGMQRALNEAGFATWATTYPSTSTSIAEAADVVARQLRSDLPNAELHAVTHSMGGILVRHLGERGLRWKRIVMLAPPNRGSHVARSLRVLPLFQQLLGPAGGELGDAGSRWPYPPAPFGVIAGVRRRSLMNPVSWLSGAMLPPDAPHDGTVLVEEAQLEGMSGFATVDADHTTIMDHPTAQALTIRFLRDGVFV